MDVTLTVADVIPDPPTNLTSNYGCDTLQLCWDYSVADSFGIYNNGAWVANVIANCYTFTVLDNMNCYITTWYGGNESQPSEIISFEITWPENLEPENFAVEDINNNIVYLSWDVPLGCAVEDGFNIYRDEIKINEELITELNYTDTLESYGTYEYYATAVYYFGESDPSNIATVVLTSFEEVDHINISVFPNPVNVLLNIQSVELISKVELFNNLGMVVLSEIVNDNTYQFNVTKINPGIYFIKIETEKDQILRKIVIE